MGRRKMDSELHRIKLETGTVYQTSKGGNYYFRYQINGERKCVSLKTANQEEAVRKARELLPTVQATNLEVIATHVKVARKLATQTRSLPVSKIWETYASHPERSLPATVREQLSYEATLEEFLRFLGPGITMFSQITEAHVIKFAEHLRHTNLPNICGIRRSPSPRTTGKSSVYGGSSPRCRNIGRMAIHSH